MESWKLVFVGKHRVGLSSFLMRLVQGIFVETIDEYFEMESIRKVAEIDGVVCIYEPYTLSVDDLFDHAMTEIIFKNGQAFIIAYSCTDRSSFEFVKDIITRITEIKECAIENVPVVLIETKSDLATNRQVTVQEGQDLAAKYELKFFVTSALLAQGIEESVHELIRLARAQEELRRTIRKSGGKRPIPPSKIKFPVKDSTLVSDISMHLFDNPQYSDLTIMVENKSIHVHKAVLFGRLPSFMEKINADDQIIDLESTLSYPVVYSIFKYVYLGKFERAPGASDEQYKTAIMKWEVFNLLPILQNDAVVPFKPLFERLFNLNFMSDLKVVVNNNNKKKQQQHEIYCHKMILCARSEYFRAMYSAGFKESGNTELIIDDCSYDAVMFLIKYYYLDLHEIEDESIVIDVLQVANRYNEQLVLHIISRYFSTKITTDSVCYIIALCELFALDNELKQVCYEYISYRYSKVAKTSGFKQLSVETRAALEAQQTAGLWLVEKEKQDESQLIKLIKNMTL